MLNWVMVGAIVGLIFLGPTWMLGCVNSWLWSLAPFWVTALVLMLHQLYLLCLWRAFRPRTKKGEDKPKVKGVNMSAEAQAARVKAGSDAELRLAVGYAIREEFAKSGNLDQAIAKTRDLIRDASMSAARDRSNR
jgi:hypothetical protein